MTLLLVGVGGFAGAIARYLVDGWLANAVRGAFPWRTFAISISGSFALGLLFGLAIERSVLPSDIRAPLMVGFLGAYTTFSTFMLERWRLVEEGSLALAVANLVGIGRHRAHRRDRGPRARTRPLIRYAAGSTVSVDSRWIL